MTVWNMKTKFNKETEILKKMQVEVKMGINHPTRRQALQAECIKSLGLG